MPKSNWRIFTPRSCLKSWTDNDGSFVIPSEALIPGEFVLDFVRPDNVGNGTPVEISPIPTDAAIDAMRANSASPVNGKTSVFTLEAPDEGEAPRR